MFTSLIGIFVLLFVGLAALLVALSGRATESQAMLSNSKRFGLLAFGLLAWGGAYWLYHQHDAGVEKVAERAPRETSPAPKENTLSLREATPALADRLIEPSVSDEATDDAAPAAKAMAEREITPALEERLIEVPAPGAPIVRPQEPARSLPATLLPAAVTTAPSAPVNRNAAPGVARQPSAANKRPSKPKIVKPAKSVKLMATSESGKGTTIHVLNALGLDQTQERLTLAIEGRPLAQLDVSRAKPTVHVPIVLPRPGMLNYTLTGTSLRDGYTRVAGKGCIEMTHQSSFEIRRSEDGTQAYLYPIRKGRN